MAVTRINICKNGMMSLSRSVLIMYYTSVFIYFWIFSTPVVSLIFGSYLYICINWFHIHFDEAFSSLRIANYKSFTRFHIKKDGDLEIFTLAVDKVTDQPAFLCSHLLITLFALCSCTLVTKCFFAPLWINRFQRAGSWIRGGNQREEGLISSAMTGSIQASGGQPHHRTLWDLYGLLTISPLKEQEPQIWNFLPDCTALAVLRSCATASLARKNNNNYLHHTLLFSVSDDLTPHPANLDGPGLSALVGVPALLTSPAAL